MMAGTPAFWWQGRGWKAAALWPLSLVYGFVSGWRMRNARPFLACVPVLCVGNFTLGGAGKTPTALALAKVAQDMGYTPGFLSRGYGGKLEQAIVDRSLHTADMVGDEPLLLAGRAITVISRDRADGARLLVSAGVDLIIMDDGFQSARVFADYALIVADGRRGIGNGLVFPAGPLRVPLGLQQAAASALLVIRNGQAGQSLLRRMANLGKPVFTASLEPVDAEDLGDRRVLAFAGIADPAKFERTLEGLGAIVVERRDFPDHAHMPDAAIEALLRDAKSAGLALVTTAKDAVRLQGRGGVAHKLLKTARVVDVELAFADGDAPRQIIAATCEVARMRLAR